MNCLVTGASRGIGKAIAQNLASKGYGVTLCARNRELLEQARAELPQLSEHQRHTIWELDLSDLTKLNSLEPPQPLKEFHHFINCAGIAGTAPFLVQSPATVERVLAVNLYAPLLLAKQVAKAMIRRRSDAKKHIVFMSSVLAQRGMVGSAVYSATKAGLEGFTRSFAREVGRQNIAVNCVAPGLVNTDMGVAADPKMMESNIFPGLVSTDEVAAFVAFLLGSQSITGQSLVIDNGGSV